MSISIHVAVEVTTLIYFLNAASEVNQGIVTRAASSSLFLPLLRRMKERAGERMHVLVDAPLLASPARLSRGGEVSFMQDCILSSTAATEFTR